MEQWQRRRHPDDVPTPIAVAVADFCRRASAKAPSAVVREALAVLSDDDDFRVKALTDAEPEVHPLGPFAVVDLIINGTPPATAAQREKTGYYTLVRTMAAQTAAPVKIVAKPSPPPRMPPKRTAAVQEDDEEEEEQKVEVRAARRQKKAEQTMAEKIAPKKRLPVAPVEKKIAAEVQSPFRKKNLPLPRGKFTRIEAEASRLDELFKPEAKQDVMSLFEQSGNRIALRKTLERQYVVKRGVAPSGDDVDDLLKRHQLLETIEKRERGTILSALTESHGAMVNVAFAMGLNSFEVDRLIAALEIRGEVTEIRDRWVREALSIRNLPLRLQMLGRSKYLADLKIGRKFKEALTRDILELLEELPVMPDLDTLVTVAAKRHALNAESLRSAIDRLGLETQLDFQPAAEPQDVT